MLGLNFVVVDQELLNAMLYREKKLRSAHLRNLSNPISRERATRYIRLRVVREFGYPDYVAEVSANLCVNRQIYLQI